MDPIRCPECGLTNYHDDLTFPFCGQCREDLVRCGHCRHFSGETCHHTRGAAHYTSDGGGAKSCPDFRSRSTERGTRLSARLSAPIWVSVLLLVLLTSLAAASWFIDPVGRYFRGNPLSIKTAVPEAVLPGQTFTVSMLITNPVKYPSSRIYIEVDPSFLAAADWGVPSPAPERIDRYRGKLLMQFSSLSPGEQLLVELPFIARKVGTAVFSANIYAPSNQLRHQVTIPISITDRLRPLHDEGVAQ